MSSSSSARPIETRSSLPLATSTASTWIGERTDIFGHGGARAEAERLGSDFLGEIPLDVAIRVTSDAGQPITASEPDGLHAAAYRDLAMAVLGKISAETTRTAPTISME